MPQDERLAMMISSSYWNRSNWSLSIGGGRTVTSFSFLWRPQKWIWIRLSKQYLMWVQSLLLHMSSFSTTSLRLGSGQPSTLLCSCIYYNMTNILTVPDLHNVYSFYLSFIPYHFSNEPSTQSIITFKTGQQLPMNESRYIFKNKCNERRFVFWSLWTSCRSAKLNIIFKWYLRCLCPDFSTNFWLPQHLLLID
jgi:hypothetical protein